MTAPHQAPPWRERTDHQWADYGVNVGHAVYGGIHFHPPAALTGPFRQRRATPGPAPDPGRVARAARHAALRSALTGLARACGRAADALAYLRPDEAGRKEER